MKRKLKYRLGIDMGISSIGWAIVELDDSGAAVDVVNLGVRKFNSGREDKTQAPLAGVRRQKRLMRRQRARFLRRRNRLVNKLTSLGLIPTDALEVKTVADCTHPQISGLGIKNTPYHLRAAALNIPLPPYALGRVIFALNQRRGFKSNRRQDKDSVSKDFYEGIQNLEESIREFSEGKPQSSSLGAYFADRLDNDQPVLDKRKGDGSEKIEGQRKGLQTTRAMYISEFRAIQSFQSQFADSPLSEDAWNEIYEIIFHQRPLKPVERGKCQLYGPKGLDLPRAHASDPLFQQMRIWQDINNFKLRTPDDTSLRHLSNDERDKIIKKLKTQKTISFSKIRTLLGLHADTEINISRSKSDEKMSGLQTDIIMSDSSCFGDAWHSLEPDQKSSVIEILEENMDDDDRIEKLMVDFNLTEAQADNVCEQKLESGTARFSTRALSEIVSLISTSCVDQSTNRYMSVTEALAELSGTGFIRADREIPEDTRLPYYAQALPEVGMHQKFRSNSDEKKYGIIGNPSVHISLNQLRHLVNAIIDEYGLPASIAVELARDMKLNKKEKEKVQRNIRDNKKLKDEMLDRCQKHGLSINEDSRMDFLKYKLWLELSKDCCNRKCPYTGETISISRLFSSEIQIEHILPRSRTLDDSPANLTLATRDANKMKGNETPYEYFKRLEESGADSGEAYQNLLLRVAALPDNKKWRFLPDAMERLADEERWLSSMLNDTRYMSRIAHKYLAFVCGDVQVSPGRLTSKARRQWLGETDGLEKDRDLDHRHHALDALTVALVSRRAVQLAQKAAGKDEDLRGHSFEKLTLPCPIPQDKLRNKTRELIGKMVVSHRVDHGPQASWHKEGPKAHYKDEVVNFLKSPKTANPLYPVKHFQATQGKEHINFYPHNGVHFVDFWRVPVPEDKGITKHRIEYIPVYYHQIMQYRDKKLMTRPHPAAKLIMRLYKGDVLVIGDAVSNDIRLVKQILPSKGNECLKHISVNSARSEEKYYKKSGFKTILSKKWKKARIDILGRIFVGS